MQYKNYAGSIVSPKLKLWEITRFFPAPNLIRRATLSKEAAAQLIKLGADDVCNYLADSLERGDAAISKLRNGVYAIITTKFYFRLSQRLIEITYISVNTSSRRRKHK